MLNQFRLVFAALERAPRHQFDLGGEGQHIAQADYKITHINLLGYKNKLLGSRQYSVGCKNDFQIERKAHSTGLRQYGGRNAHRAFVQLFDKQRQRGIFHEAFYNEQVKCIDLCTGGQGQSYRDR